MIGYFILLFTALPALEFYLLFKIGSVIGALETFVIIILTGVIGAFLAKSQGLTILSQIQSEVSKKQIPAKHILHGFLVFGGGLLLLTPGFLTDIIGFSMVIPGTRHIIAGWISFLIRQGIFKGSIHFMSTSTFKSRGGPPPSTADTNSPIEAEFKKIDD